MYLKQLTKQSVKARHWRLQRNLLTYQKTSTLNCQMKSQECKEKIRFFLFAWKKNVHFHPATQIILFRNLEKGFRPKVCAKSARAFIQNLPPTLPTAPLINLNCALHLSEKIKFLRREFLTGARALFPLIPAI